MTLYASTMYFQYPAALCSSRKALKDGACRHSDVMLLRLLLCMSWGATPCAIAEKWSLLVCMTVPLTLLYKQLPDKSQFSSDNRFVRSLYIAPSSTKTAALVNEHSAFCSWSVLVYWLLLSNLSANGYLFLPSSYHCRHRASEISLFYAHLTKDIGVVTDQVTGDLYNEIGGDFKSCQLKFFSLKCKILIALSFFH